jgi:hypothetical protein
MMRLSWIRLVCLSVLAGCNREKTADHAAMAMPVKTVADTGATTNPPAELPMEVQHRTMDSVQANYGTLLTALPAKDKASATAAANNIAAFADRIPVFMIHKAGVADDSLKQWARMLKGQAMRTAQLAQADSFDAAQEVAGKMNATCNTCHEMYRVEEEEHHDEHAAPAKKAAKKPAAK